MFLKLWSTVHLHQNYRGKSGCAYEKFRVHSPTGLTESKCRGRGAKVQESAFLTGS